ncbi:MAG: hypothetical protein ACYDIC_16050 [Desulfobaccales bacterium]
MDSQLRPKLSAWIRRQNEQQNEIPELNSYNISTLQTGLPDYSPREKQIILLQNIERKTKYPGQRVELSLKYDSPLAWASNDEEFLYYIISLQDRGLIINNMTSGLCHVTITANGWDYREKLERHIEERTQAFVAMSFSEDLKSVWEGPIYNAITKAGYKPYRVDAEPHIDRIDVKIISEIKNSRFIVADITEQKRGVYFEAGYALGMGLPVIWCVRKDDLENAHFDTRQYNHIVWETADDLENQLYDFICAIIGKGKEVP